MNLRRIAPRGPAFGLAFAAGMLLALASLCFYLGKPGPAFASSAVLLTLLAITRDNQPKDPIP